MKTLQKYVLESIESIDPTKENIINFLKENYNGNFNISNKPNKDGKFEVSSEGDVKLTNNKLKYLTNDLFEFTIIKGKFECDYCKSLKSLKGAPRIVNKDFNCSYCPSLESINGAPEEVGLSFSCNNCRLLKSLEGAPKEVGKNFNCYKCINLSSLKYAPKNVGGNFRCKECAVKFTEEEVKKYSNVKGNISK